MLNINSFNPLTGRHLPGQPAVQRGRGRGEHPARVPQPQRLVLRPVRRRRRLPLLRIRRVQRHSALPVQPAPGRPRGRRVAAQGEPIFYPIVCWVWSVITNDNFVFYE